MGDSGVIFLFVFIINLPTGESDKTFRHEFKTVAECESALKTMVKNDKNVIAYCATGNERYFNSTWWTDERKNLNK